MKISATISLMIMCEMFTTCMCLPPACDPLNFERSEQGTELSSQLLGELPDWVCLLTQFMGRGCDRCFLEPIPPLPCEDPCETTTCPEGQTCMPYLGCIEMPGGGDLCALRTCPEGQECNPENFLCCDIETGECDTPTFDLCGLVTCPAGSVCESATGGCWNPDTGECAQADITFDACTLVTCPAGSSCDPDTGLCCDDATGECSSPSAPDLCTYITCPPEATCDPTTAQCCNDATGECVPPEFDVCSFVTCPAGQTCNPETALCE